MINKVATTVKIPQNLYDDFKILGVRNKLTLQRLVEKTVFRYVNEEIFRTEINNFNIPVISSPIVTSIDSTTPIIEPPPSSLS